MSAPDDGLGRLSLLREPSPTGEGTVASVLSPRAPLWLAALVAVSYALLVAFEARGVVLIVPLWLLATPLLLSPMRALLVREAMGVGFLLVTAAYCDVLDNILGWEQRVSLVVVLLGLAYVASRWRRAFAVLRSPIAALFVVFLLQQLASAFAHESAESMHIVQNRAAGLIAILAVAVLMRDEEGRRLAPALVLLGALMSLPVMLRELSDPELLLPYVNGSYLLHGGPGANEAARAGGIYGQPNNAASAFSFALPLALTLRAPARLRAALVVALGACVLLAGSRGGFAAFLVVLIAYGLATTLSSRSPQVIFGLLVAAVACYLLRAPIGEGLLVLTNPLVGKVPAVERLQEVLLAMTGRADALLDDDSQRLGLMQEALRMIAEKPLFGYGTGNFLVFDDLRSHVQFLEVLGENGFVGAVFYAVFLGACALAVLRIPKRDRVTAGLLFLAWLLTNLDHHDVVEYRYLLLPIGLLCGYDPDVDAVAALDLAAASTTDEALPATAPAGGVPDPEAPLVEAAAAARAPGEGAP